MSVESTFIDGLVPVSNRFAQLAGDLLKEALIQAGKQATGTLVQSVNTKVRTDGDRAVIEIYAEDYLRYVDQGRRPGKFPPLQPIKKWVSIKGLPAEAAFPIARKIAMKGINPTRVVNPTLKKVEELFGPSYEKELERILGAVLVNDIFSRTNTLGQILPANLTFK